MLSELIERYQQTQKAWRAKVDKHDSDPSEAEWQAYEAAEEAVLSFPCKNFDDVRLKAAFVLADENAMDSVKNSVRPGDGMPTLVFFLRSLVGDPQACVGAD
jgi:hypothetical protein